jgi:hypothetical protein
MATHKYKIASEEGADRYGGEVGDQKTIDIPADETKAVVAAGWVEPVEEKAKEANK